MDYIGQIFNQRLKFLYLLMNIKVLLSECIVSISFSIFLLITSDNIVYSVLLHNISCFYRQCIAETYQAILIFITANLSKF